MWAERNARGVEGDPPCGECMVYLNENNIITAHIYDVVRGQVILFFDGERNREYDINHVAVWEAIDHFPCQSFDKWEVFEKVLAAWHHFQKERNK